MKRAPNPFGLSKANDLSDRQIFDLWVDTQFSDHKSVVALARPSSPTPTFILGGKGSGKTHLMRYLSYPVQKLRFAGGERSVIEGLQADGYIGVYIRCSGLSSSRFQGKGQSEEAWAEVFSYYFELWLAQALLKVARDFVEADFEVERAICKSAAQLFDTSSPDAESIAGLLVDIGGRQQKLDFEVNNAAFTRVLQPLISVTRGRLVFGLPALLRAHLDDLKDVIFSYELDEFENLTEAQQKHVNTLLREREAPCTFKVGARQYGIHTHATFSGNGEVNLKDSEFEEFRLDQRFRENEETYSKLARALIERRLENSPVGEQREWRNSSELDRAFAQEDLGAITFKTQSAKRPYFVRASRALTAAVDGGGLQLKSSPQELLEKLFVPDQPVLEKLNLLFLYGAWSKGAGLDDEVQKIQDECARFLHGDRTGRYDNKLGHYKTHLVAQLLREQNKYPIYTGLKAFVRMSEGQPRALLNLLKETVDWATFQGEHPFSTDAISVEAQSKGALRAAEWFYNGMTNAGPEGKAIIQAIDRLAELFRINHYADNPVECSLIAFSTQLTEDISDRAREILEAAEDRSFIVSVLGGQFDRNSLRVDRKLQINRMLCPRWGLPTGRRGIAVFKAREINAVFDPERSAEFRQLSAEWMAKMNAPFSGRKSSGGPGQPELFPAS